MLEWLLGILLLFAFGFLSGFITSLPIGPSNFWLINKIPQYNYKKKFVSFLLGIIAVDILYSLLAIWGYYEYFKENNLTIYIGIFGGVGLFSIGVIEFFRARLTKNIRAEIRQSQKIGLNKLKSDVRDFFMGVFFCGSSPGVIITWLYISKLAFDYGLSNIKGTDVVFYFAGIAAGDFTLYYLFIRLARKGLNFFTNKKIKDYRYFTSIIFAFFGLLALYKTNFWELIF